MTHVIDSTTRRLVAVVIEAVRRWREPCAVARLRSLHGLDAMALKDIGIHRSEISSIDAEFHGDAERTRRRLA